MGAMWSLGNMSSECLPKSTIIFIITIMSLGAIWHHLLPIEFVVVQATLVNIH
jgi:hypothetical protein